MDPAPRPRQRSHYCAKFDAAGVHPGISSASKTWRFPFTGKQDLRDNYRMACSRAAGGGGPHPRLVRAPRANPRSSATPATMWTPAELIARSIHASGGRPGDIVHIAYGYGLFSAAWAPTTAPRSSAAR